MSHLDTPQSEFEPREAFAGLRAAVRASVTPPPATTLRARAERQLRRRRLATVGLVAAAVVAVLLGTSTILRPTTTPPPPAQTPSPSIAPSTSTSIPPTGPPRPPRPAPRPTLPVPERPTAINDPIAAVDWANATLTVPPRDGCPSGTLRFVDGQTEGFPQMILMLDDGVPGQRLAYGDLTGDGSAEAVIEASCLAHEEDAHAQSALLVFTRDSGGALRSIGGWVGPIEFINHTNIWVHGGQILTEQVPSLPGYDYVYAPGTAAAYEWDGVSFVPVPSGLTPVVPPDDETLGPPIDLGPDDGYVARALGCPGGVIRFGQHQEGYRVDRDGVVYGLGFTIAEPYLADLDGDGQPYVLITVHCREANVTAQLALSTGTGLRGQGLLVLQRTPTGFAAVDLLTVPDRVVSGWRFDKSGVLTAYTSRYESGEVEPTTWVWNGQYFQP